MLLCGRGRGGEFHAYAYIRDRPARYYQGIFFVVVAFSNNRRERFSLTIVIFSVTSFPCSASLFGFVCCDRFFFFFIGEGAGGRKRGGWLWQ